MAESGQSWQQLIDLLGPIHDQAAATARRMSRSPDDGDDLFQEAVIRAYEKLPALRDPSRFRAWFYTVLLTVHRSRTRRGFWRRFLPLEDRNQNWIDPAGDDGTAWEDKRTGAERASRALAGLSAVQREAIVLFKIEGFSIEEIAALQKVSVSAVKSRLARGRERLRRHYERLGFRPRHNQREHRSSEVGAPPFLQAARARAVVETRKCGRQSRPLPEGETS